MRTNALRGAFCGLIAGFGLVVIEHGLVASAAGAELADGWDHALLGVVLATFILWPAVVLGALLSMLGGLLGDRGTRWIRPSWFQGRVVLLLGVGFVATAFALVQFPALTDTPWARYGVLAFCWFCLWVGMVRLWSELGPRKLTLTPRARWWAIRGSAVGISALLWGGAFAIVGLDKAPRVRGVLADRSPGVLIAAPSGDRDGDGFGTLSGGGDCDDDNPSIHPGAREVAGNGIDEDCDGQDRPLSTVTSAARRALHIGVEAGGAAMAAVPAPAVPEVVPKLSVMVITVDTLRPDFTGFHGADPSPTPHMDAQAKQGVVFERAYAQAPLTKESVSSMMSGRYFSELDRSRMRFTKIYNTNEMLAETLQKAGYTTSGITTHRYLSDGHGYTQGFERFNCVVQGRPQWTADVAVDEAIKVLSEIDTPGGKPYFMWLHLIDPHHPYDAHKSVRDAAALTEGPKDLYRREIRWTDANMGRLFEAMEARGSFDRTLLVIHSDHGESFGDHGYKYHGQALFEEQVRSVLMVRAPDVTPGRRGTPVMLLDTHPTIVSMATGKSLAEQAIVGDPALGRPISLWPTLKRGKALPERPIFIERISDVKRQDRKAVVSDGWKLIHSLSAGTWALYDLKSDPNELVDLYQERPERAAALNTILQRFVAGLVPGEVR